MVATTTPATINRYVTELCKRLRTQEPPRFVKVEPRADSGFADCFNDVARHVQEFGGRIVHGWQLWEWPRVLIEAEFHGVWESPDGCLIDVQKKPENEREILFVPDTRLKFEGKRIDNVRHAIGKDPLIATYIQEQNLFFKLFRLRYGDTVGQVTLDAELAQILYQQRNLQKELVQKYS